MLFKCNWAKKS